MIRFWMSLKVTLLEQGQRFDVKREWSAVTSRSGIPCWALLYQCGTGRYTGSAGGGGRSDSSSWMGCAKQTACVFLLRSTLYSCIRWEVPFSWSLCASTKQCSLKLNGGKQESAWKKTFSDLLCIRMWNRVIQNTWSLYQHGVLSLNAKWECHGMAFGLRARACWGIRHPVW